MAASCISMVTIHKLSPSLESLATGGGGGGGLTLSSCAKGHRSSKVEILSKPRAKAAVSRGVCGLSCIIPVMGNTSRRCLKTATAGSEGPPSAEVIDEEEDYDFGLQELSEGEVLESEEAERSFEASGRDDTEKGSESEASYKQTDYPIPESTKLYVGNIPYDITSEELARIFEASGVVELVEVIYDKATERSRGFGFVTMSTVEEAGAAMQKINGYEVGGRALRVNIPQVPRGHARSSRPQSYDSLPQVYVSNISPSTTADALRSAFEKAGNVLDAKVVFDQRTGKSRGFGFVTFTSEADVDAAVSTMNGVDLEGRSIIVKVAIPRSTQIEN